MNGNEQYLFPFGGQGAGPGEFDFPNGIRVLRTAPQSFHVWVSDTNNHRVQVFDLDGTYRDSLGSHGCCAGQFDGPTGIDFRDDEVFIADLRNHRVQVFQIAAPPFHPAGKFLRTWGAEGNGNGFFHFPARIAVHNDIVYVTDAGNNRVQVFDRGGIKVKDPFGVPGNGQGQFNSPTGIAVDEHGIFVVDRGNNRVQVFNLQGHFLKMIQPMDAFPFNTPTDVTVDNGEVFIVDKDNHRVHVFEAHGQYRRLRDPFGSFGMGDGQFNQPNYIAVHDQRVYVCDRGNYRVQVWKRGGN